MTLLKKTRYSSKKQEKFRYCNGKISVLQSAMCASSKMEYTVWKVTPCRTNTMLMVFTSKRRAFKYARREAKARSLAFRVKEDYRSVEGAYGYAMA